MPTSFWRQPDLPARLQGLDHAGFALELLRRAPAYRTDHARAARLLAAGRITDARRKEVLARRWGLSFRS